MDLNRHVVGKGRNDGDRCKRFIGEKTLDYMAGAVEAKFVVTFPAKMREPWEVRQAESCGLSVVSGSEMDVPILLGVGPRVELLGENSDFDRDEELGGVEDVDRGGFQAFQ